MTCGIYCIEHIASGKKYIGKSKDIERRWYGHKWALKKDVRGQDTNRYLWAAVKKYGFENFKFWIVEELPTDDRILSERELYWMDFYVSCDGTRGYNLRRDSSSGMEVHEETRKLLSESNKGEKNGNYGNKWNDDQRSRMSEIAKERHAAGIYDNPETVKKKKKAAKDAAERLKSDPERFDSMRNKVKAYKQGINKFLQYSRAGTFLREWDTKEEILTANPTWKWQNIYSACSQYKPTYQGFIWRMVPKDCDDYAKTVVLSNPKDSLKWHVDKAISRNRFAKAPDLRESTARLIKRGFAEDWHIDYLQERYLEKYDPELLEEFYDYMNSKYDRERWEELYGEDGLGLDPERGFKD
jgi:group I intron endonuclease